MKRIEKEDVTSLFCKKAFKLFLKLVSTDQGLNHGDVEYCVDEIKKQ